MKWLSLWLYAVRQRLLKPVLDELQRQQGELRLIYEIQAGLALRSIGLHSPVFTNIWFDSTGIGTLERVLEPFRDKPDVRFLEIGSYEGRSTCWFLDNILTHPTARIVCVDTFGGSQEHVGSPQARHLRALFDYNLRRYQERVEVQEGSSRDVLPALKRESFDIVYIDGSHFADDVYHDGRFAFELCRRDGLIIFDDYGWTWYPHPEDNPAAGIDRFLKELTGKYTLVHKGFQVVIQKTDA